MLIDYVRIARPDHWFKNVFILPGALLAWLASPPDNPLAALATLAMGVVSACLVASSNYAINEWLDAPEDRLHPDKRDRPAASGRIRARWAYAEWLLLAAAGLGLAAAVGFLFFLVAATLFVQGVVYNIPPMRSKNLPVLDVLSESVNNPIRFLMGWYGIGCMMIPPVSFIASYWMLGAFLMAVKRLAEYRRIGDKAAAAAYRKSFAYYTEEILFSNIVFFATAFALFAGIFLARYRLELVLSVPFFAGVMGYYMHLAFLPDSPAQRPEKLYRNMPFMAILLVTVAVSVALLIFDLPFVYRFFQTTVPSLKGAAPFISP